jgi:hypothetical protein
MDDTEFGSCPGCIALQAKLERAEQSLKNAKTAAREGLMDMAEQNAKLVAAYVEKKREVKQLQVGFMLNAGGSSCTSLQHMSVSGQCMFHPTTKVQQSS